MRNIKKLIGQFVFSLVLIFSRTGFPTTHPLPYYYREGKKKTPKRIRRNWKTQEIHGFQHNGMPVSSHKFWLHLRKSFQFPFWIRNGCSCSFNPWWDTCGILEFVFPTWLQFPFLDSFFFFFFWQCAVFLCFFQTCLARNLCVKLLKPKVWIWVICWRICQNHLFCPLIRFPESNCFLFAPFLVSLFLCFLPVFHVPFSFFSCLFSLFPLSFFLFIAALPLLLPDLPKMDISGWADGYVRVFLGSEDLAAGHHIKKTEVVENCKAPTWNDQFEMFVSSFHHFSSYIVLFLRSYSENSHSTLCPVFSFRYTFLLMLFCLPIFPCSFSPDVASKSQRELIFRVYDQDKLSKDDVIGDFRTVWLWKWELHKWVSDMPGMTWGRGNNKQVEPLPSQSNNHLHHSFRAPTVRSSLSLMVSSSFDSLLPIFLVCLRSVSVCVLFSPLLISLVAVWSMTGSSSSRSTRRKSVEFTLSWDWWAILALLRLSPPPRLDYSRHHPSVWVIDTDWYDRTKELKGKQ